LQTAYRDHPDSLAPVTRVGARSSAR